MKKHLLTLALTASFGLAGLAHAEVTVTTGAGYIDMMKALTQAFTKATGENVAKALGGNIGQMLQQVKEGNGVNVVVSDDYALNKFNDHLAPDVVELGKTPLVMIWRQGLTLKSPDSITDADVKSVAYPDPVAAIYGRAADKWLKNTGLMDKIKDKAQAANHVPQVMSYVKTGNMDVGFVNVAAYRKNKDSLGGHFDIWDNGASITMQARVVKGAENEADVKRFMEFLKSPEARAIMKEYGVE